MCNSFGRINLCLCEDSHDLILPTSCIPTSASQCSLFREFLTDPEEFLNTQVSLIKNWSENSERGPVAHWSELVSLSSDRWATRPAASSTPHWTQPSARRTVTAIVWRSKILPHDEVTNMEIDKVTNMMAEFANNTSYLAAKFLTNESGATW